MELVRLIPAGTTIPVYYFPDLKDAARVRFVGNLPPAEQGQKNTTNVLHYGALGLAMCAGGVLALIPLRRMCV